MKMVCITVGETSEKIHLQSVLECPHHTRNDAFRHATVVPQVLHEVGEQRRMQLFVRVHSA